MTVLDPHKAYMADWDEIKILEAQLGIDCGAVFQGRVSADTPLLQACHAYSQAHADTPLLSGRFELACIKAGRPYLHLLREATS